MSYLSAAKAFASRAWPFLLAAAVAGILLLTYCEGRKSGTNAADKARLEGNAKAAAMESAAKEQAAVERLEDTATIEAKHEEQINAIENATGDVRVAAACQRLRSYGRSEASLPEPCRSSR